MFGSLLNKSKSSKVKNLILLIFISVFTITPLIFRFKGLHGIGGDDTKLYYLYPWEMITNYASQLISSNEIATLGLYSTRQFLIPFYFLILILKYSLPFLNTQNLMFGLNMSLGFLSFYHFLGLWLRDDESEYNFWVKIVTSFFYSTSLFIHFTILTQDLVAIYIVSLMPLMLNLFFYGIIKKRFFYIIIAALISSIFSALFLATPWILGSFIILFPLFFYLFKKNKLFFTSYILGYVLLFILLNFYWIYHFVLEFIYSKTNIAVGITSREFIKSATLLVNSIASRNILLYPLVGLYHKNLLQDFNSPLNEYFSHWSLKFNLLNFTFPIVIVSSLLLIKKLDNNLKDFYLYVFMSWLTGLYFFTVNIGPFGINFFILLVNYIPGFTMFRWMQDKFAYGFTFSYSLIMALSLYIFLKQNIKTLYKIIFIFCFITLVMIQGLPLLNYKYNLRPLWTTKYTYGAITDFNSDFYNLIDYIKNNKRDDSRYVWIPLSSDGAYTVIQDSIYKNNWYIGAPPINVLAQIKSFGGINSFITSFTSQNTSNIKDIIVKNKYEKLLSLFKKYNINYIIYNNSISGDLASSFIYGGVEKGGYYYNQLSEEFKKEIIGRKIKDFGSRYTLYEINSSYKSSKFYIYPIKDPNNNTKVTGITYKKISNYEYRILLKNQSEKFILVFSEPYSRGWGILNNDERKSDSIISTAYKLNDTEMGFIIDPKNIHNDELSLLFLPSKIILPQIISLIALIITLISLLILFFKFYYKTKV